MAPRPAPARYMSWPVNSEYTRFSGSMPKLSRYALNSGAYRYMFSTRGMPMRKLERCFISAIRCLAAVVQARVGMGSATFCGLRERHTSRAAMSTRFGLAFLTASRAALILRIAPTSSTCPFSQVEMIRRRSPACKGTFDLKTGSGDETSTSPTVTSMNVRRQLFLQK